MLSTHTFRTSSRTATERYIGYYVCRFGFVATWTLDTRVYFELIRIHPGHRSQAGDSPEADTD